MQTHVPKTYNRQKPTFVAKFTTLLLLLTACGGQSQHGEKLNLAVASTKAGIGLIHFNTNHTIPLYKTSTDSLAFDSLRFVIEKKGSKSGRCKFVTQHLRNNLQPYTMDSGDSDKEGEMHRQMGLIHFAPQLTFRVSEKLKNGVFIVINEKKNETCFVKLNPENNYALGKEGDFIFFDPNFPETHISNWYFFETWPQAILRAHVIQVPDTIATHDMPDGNTTNFPNLGALLFNADSIYRDWVRITNRPFLAEGEKTITTWIKWKESDNIKLLLTLNGGYE